MKHLFFSIIACAISLFPATLHAQIGYQVSLLNTATGEPRAGVTVNATVTITDSADKVIYTGTQRATSNDFGVLSLVVGNAETFSNADYSKLPFFISVSVDGALIGKSQILSVPVAEYAKRTGELTKEKLVGTWKYENPDKRITYTFKEDGTYVHILRFSSGYESEDHGEYFIDDNNVVTKPIKNDNYYMDFFYIHSKNILANYKDGHAYIKQ